MILRILLCAVLQFCIIGYVFGVVPQITRLNVQCDRTGMKVNVEFDNPFNGIIFSKGHYSDPNCRWVKTSSSRRQFNFYVGNSKCGTIGTDMAVGSTSQGFKNVIIIQNDPDYQEVWDTARKLSCDWVTKLEKYVTFAPFGVDMLGVKELRFPGDTVDCWMDIQRGHGPFAPSVGGVVPIGEKLTVVIYVRDTDSSFDVHVKDCYAYDSSDYRNPNARAIKLTDERGCPVKEKLVQGFYRTRDVRTSGATIIAYGIINAFKFPERMDVFLACNVEVCKGTCPNNDCQPEVAVAGSGDESSGSTTAAPSTGGGDEEKEEGEEKPDGNESSSTTEATDTDEGEKSTDETTDSSSGTATEESESSEDTSEKPKTDTEDKEESKDEETKDEESKDEESKDEESKDEEKKDEGEEKKDGEESKDEEKKDEGEEKKDGEESKDDKEESSNDVEGEKSDDSEKKEDEKSDDAEKSDDSEKKEETKDDEEAKDEEQTKETDSSSSTSKPDSKADDEEEEESGRKAAKIKLAKKSSRKAKKADVIIPRKRSAKRPSRKNASTSSRSSAPSTKPKSGKLKKDKEVKVKKIKSKSKSKPKSSNLKTSNSVRSSKAKVKPRSIRIIRAPSSIPAAFSRQLREANMAYDQMYQRQGRHIRSRRSATVSENATFPAMMHSISIISPIEDLDEKELNAWEKMVDLEGKAEEVSLFEAITKLPTFSSEGGYCFTMVSLASASVLLAAIVMILSMSVAMACLHLHVRSSAASGKAVDLY